MGRFGNAWKALSGKKILTEAGIGKVFRGTTYAKQEVDGKDAPNESKIHKDFLACRNAYLNVPIVTGMVDKKVDQVVQEFYFDGYNKESLMQFKDRLNLLDWFHRLTKEYLIYGNSFVEVVKGKKSGKIIELKLLNPEWMHVYRKANGDVIGYTQTINGNDVALWGSTGDPTKDSAFGPNTGRPKGKLENIAHFKFNVIGSEKYGTSMIRSLLHLVNAKLSIESDIVKIFQRYSAPLIHAKVGNENLPATDADINTVGDELEDIHAESEVVTSHLVDLQVLGFDKKGMDMKTPLDYIDKNLLSGGGVPGYLLDRSEGTDGKSGEAQARSFFLHVKSIQRSLKVQFEDQIIVKHKLGTMKSKLIWEESDSRMTDAEIERIRGLVTDGILTPQKGNDLLPPKYKEKLPKPQETVMARPTQSKGPDKIRQEEVPNDPTKSTKLAKGRRLKKSDIKSPVDLDRTKRVREDK